MTIENSFSRRFIFAEAQTRPGSISNFFPRGNLEGEFWSGIKKTTQQYASVFTISRGWVAFGRLTREHFRVFFPNAWKMKGECKLGLRYLLNFKYSFHLCFSLFYPYSTVKLTVFVSVKGFSRNCHVSPSAPLLLFYWINFNAKLCFFIQICFSFKYCESVKYILLLRIIFFRSLNPIRPTPYFT